MKVWIVDDDRGIRWILEKALSRVDIESTCFESALDAMSAFEAGERPAVVVSDMRMPGMDGQAFLKQLHEADPELPVIIMTAFSDLDTTVKAFEGGAFDYLSKPFDIQKAVSLVERALAKVKESVAKAWRGDNEDAFSPVQTPMLLGQSQSMQEVFRAIGRLANTSATVLLTGESGVGKEVVARALWSHSQRKNQPFVAINMGAIPRELLESELFGHEKGAFTGATQRRLGRFEQAQGGTLFLDEIGEMPLALQTSLLRVLSQGTFYRVGGHEPIKVDVRVIAATNRDLEKQVAQGAFREDLFHRLNVIRLRLPPLRERADDIALLANHFIRHCAAEMGVAPKTFTHEALEALKAVTFPGNVRQLENVCRWLLVMAPSSLIDVPDLPQDLWPQDADLVERDTDPETRAPINPKMPPGVCSSTGWMEGLRLYVREALKAQEPHLWDHITQDIERIMIEEALRFTAGGRGQAAKCLGVGRNTLARKYKGIED